MKYRIKALIKYLPLRLLFITVLPILFSGCTHYLYSGTTSYPNDKGKADMLVYWNTTSILFAHEKKASLVTVVTCQDRAQFKPEAGAYRLYESSGDFTLANGMGSVVDSTTLFCGELKGVDAIEGGKSSQLEAYVYCNKISDPFSPAPGIPARVLPYTFTIKAQKQFTLSGDEIEPPILTNCAN